MARKGKQKRKRRGQGGMVTRRRVILAVELVLSLAFLGYFGYLFLEFTREADQFQVREVRIEGIRRLNEDAVLVRSGIDPNKNVLYFDAVAVKENIESMPLVKSCKVSQIFPDTVVLTIDERTPLATIQVNSRSFEIDEDGVVLREYEMDELPLAPFFTNVRDLEFVEPGGVVEHAALTAALDIWLAFAATPMAQDVTVSEISAGSTDLIRMYCDELPFEIRWKDSGVLEQGERLNVLWLSRGKSLDCAEYLDLRFEGELVCK